MKHTRIKYNKIGNVLIFHLIWISQERDISIGISIPLEFKNSLHVWRLYGLKWKYNTIFSYYPPERVDL